MIEAHIRKACELGEWCFVAEVILTLGFPSDFMHKIMACVTFNPFSFNINGPIEGFFRRKEGLKAQ